MLVCFIDGCFEDGWDIFGDRWETTFYTKLMYWIELCGQTTIMVTETLIFGCSMTVGCWEPFSVNIDQMFHLDL